MWREGREEYAATTKFYNIHFCSASGLLQTCDEIVQAIILRWREDFIEWRRNPIYYFFLECSVYGLLHLDLPSALANDPSFEDKLMENWWYSSRLSHPLHSEHSLFVNVDAMQFSQYPDGHVKFLASENKFLIKWLAQYGHKYRMIMGIFFHVSPHFSFHTL